MMDTIDDSTQRYIPLQWTLLTGTRCTTEEKMNSQQMNKTLGNNALNENFNIDKTNVYFQSKNFTCLLNEISMKNQVSFVYSPPVRIQGTPDHMPTFTCSVKSFGNFNECFASGSSKRLAREEASKMFFYEHKDIFVKYKLPTWVNILTCGDIESNPGPIQSRPLPSRYNDPRVVKLEKAISNREDKIKTLIKQLRRFAKDDRLYTHMFGLGSATSLNGVAENISRITNFLEHSLPQMHESFTNSVNITNSNMLLIKEDLIKVLVVVILVHLFIKFSHYRTALCIILGFVCLHYGLPPFVVQIIEELKGGFSKLSAHMSSAEDFIYSPLFVTCGKLIFGVLAFICVKIIPGKKDWDTYLLRLDRIPKSYEGGKKIYDVTSEYWNIAHEQIKMLVLGKTKEDLQAARSIYVEIDNWALEIQKYIELGERDKIDMSSEVANIVEKLYLDGLKYQSDKNLNKETQRMVNSLIYPAKYLYEYVSCSPSKGGGPRMKPVCIWLIGESGIGKTEMVYPLCIDILRAMGYKDPKIFHHQVYARQVEIEFWDGYKQQKIIIYDDAFQMVDDKAKPNPEIFEVIRSCNTFPQHLHMAALHDKNTYSSAEILIFTTNDPKVKIDSLTFPRAFTNRMFENAYTVSIKPEYSISKIVGQETVYQLNTSLLDPTKTNLDIYSFQRIIPDDSAHGHFTIVNDPIDYFEFSQKMVSSWKTKKDNARAKLQWLEDYAARPFVTHMNSEEEFIDAISYDFAAEILRARREGKTLEEFEYDIMSEDDKWAQYLRFRDKPTKWNEFSSRFKIIYSAFKTKCELLRSEANSVLSSYPLLTIMGGLGLVWAMLAAYDMFSSTDEADGYSVEASGDCKTIKQSSLKVEASGDCKTSKLQTLRVEASGDCKTARNTHLSVESMTVQGCSDEVAFTMITTILRNNTYKLSYKRGDEDVWLGNVTFLKGWIAIMPYHYLVGFWARKIQSNSLIYLSQPGLDKVIQFPLSHLMEIKNDKIVLSDNVRQLTFNDGHTQDAIVFSLFKTMCHVHRDITKHIVRQGDLANMRGEFMGSFPTFAIEGKELARYYKDASRIRASDTETEIYYLADENAAGLKSYRQREMWLYNCHSHKGDCGSLVGVYNTTVERKIIGLHIAGGDHDCGGAAPLTFERIERAINSFKLVSHFHFELEDDVNILREPKVPSGVFVPLGVHKIRAGQATKTNLRKSSIYGKLSEPTTAPAILRPTMIEGVKHDPLLSGLKKCGVNPTYIPKDILESALNDVERVVTQNGNVRKEPYARVLTYEQAVKGTGDVYEPSANRNTSPGFKYNGKRLPGKPGKQSWLGSGEYYDLTSEYARAMQADVNQLEEDCYNGLLCGVYCTDTLKDERRELEKVLKGKTRVFSTCQIHFVLAFRKYFLGFAAFLMHNRIDNEIAVGTNVYSSDWNKIALRMRVKGKHVIAGDFSNYDGCLNPQILWSILDIINNWYDDGERNARIRMGLWAHVVHSVHVFDDNIYMWTHSQPSGNPFTVIINSIYNSIVMRLSWIIVMKEHNMAGMLDFNKYVSFISFGDDNLLNIHSSVVDKYNQITITEALATINHTYTDERKSGEEVATRTLDDVLFLKRAFKYSHELQRYVAPLRKDVIYEMINWTRNVPDPNEILRTNIQTAAREISLHGVEAFNEFMSKIKTVRGDIPQFPPLETYSQYITDVRDRPEEYYF